MRRLKEYLQYLAVRLPLSAVRFLPHRSLPVLSGLAAAAAFPFPGIGGLIDANLQTVFPDWDVKQRRRIGRMSLKNLFWNMLELLWTNGRTDRIERCYQASPELKKTLCDYARRNVALILVNPHLGSWEASGVMAAHYLPTPLVAVAKPVHNPRINQLLNVQVRQLVPGMEIVFSRGAVRASIAALKAGKNLGLLVDQNTRLRDGGVWVDWCGLPVASSTSPALLKRYCDQHRLPAELLCGVSLRRPDGVIEAHVEKLPRPFAEYADDREVLQDLMKLTEQLARRHPDQYLWLYRRFAHIPPDCPPEIRCRYPAYARVPEAKFFIKKSGGKKS